MWLFDVCIAIGPSRTVSGCAAETGSILFGWDSELWTTRPALWHQLPAGRLAGWLAGWVSPFQICRYSFKGCAISQGIDEEEEPGNSQFNGMNR